MSFVYMALMAIGLAGFYFVGYRDGLDDRASLSEKPHVHRWGRWHFVTFVEHPTRGAYSIDQRRCKSCGFSESRIA